MFFRDCDKRFRSAIYEIRVNRNSCHFWMRRPPVRLCRIWYFTTNFMDDRLRVYILNFWTIQKPNWRRQSVCVPIFWLLSRCAVTEQIKGLNRYSICLLEYVSLVIVENRLLTVYIQSKSILILRVIALTVNYWTSFRTRDDLLYSSLLTLLSLLLW